MKQLQEQYNRVQSDIVYMARRFWVGHPFVVYLEKIKEQIAEEMKV
jgi:hypothetical protein